VWRIDCPLRLLLLKVPSWVLLIASLFRIMQ
jgi:hypothetical protein